MASEYCKKILKVTVAQTCQNLGWHAIQSTPLDIMVDILHRYLQEVSRTTHRYCEQFGRTEPNLDDLGLAFQDAGVSLVELEEYMNNVDPIKPLFQVPKFPIPTKNDILNYRSEIADNDSNLDEISESDIHNGEDSGSNSQQDSTLQQLLSAAPDGTSDDTTAGLKRANPESADTPPQLSKRPRMMTEEELSNMNAARDLTSVFMTSGGLISPAREGKLPDAKTPQYAVPVSRPATPEGTETENIATNGTEQDSKETAVGSTPEDKADKPEETPKKGGRKKPVCKPKKLNFDKKKGVSKKDENNDGNKEPATKSKKRTPSKAAKTPKKDSGKKVDGSKASLTGITPLAAKNASEAGKNDASDKNVANVDLDEVDNTIESVVQNSCKKKQAKEDNKVTQDTSLDDTIEEVIQRAMQGHANESFESAPPKTPDVQDASPSKDITPPKVTVKTDDPSKSDKKRGRGRLTKAARKEFANDPIIDTASRDRSFLEGHDPAADVSPFHNPPGFPSRPPLPPLHGFHTGHHPAFTTNLGPPPPAHQGASPSMLPSSSFFPPFPPPMHNLPQFGDLPFSRLGMMPLFSSSQYPSMLPTPAHTPHLPPFYSSTNENPAHSISVGAEKSSFKADRISPQAPQTSVSVTSPAQSSPIQFVSIKSEPKSASQSAKIEIKSSMLTPIITESTSSGSSKPEKVEKPVDKPEKLKNKEHKKDKKDKSEKKDKSKKKERKDKVKEEIQESNEDEEKVKNVKTKSKDKKKSKIKEETNKDEPLQKITLKIGSSSKIYIKPVSSPAPEEPVKSPPPARSPSPPPPSPPPPAPPPVQAPIEAPPPSTTSPEVVPRSPAQRGRPRKPGRPPKGTPKKYATRTPAQAAPPPLPPIVEPEDPPTMSLITETVGTTLDEDGNKIWICPKCGRPDDGSAMIGCDSCDDWYHWVCVKIVVPPKEEDSWFCTRCISKQQQQLQARRKKKKHKKDK